MPISKQYRVNEPTVIQEIIDGEAIIADLGQGFYYSLDQGGSLFGALLCRVGRPLKLSMPGHCMIKTGEMRLRPV